MLKEILQLVLKKQEDVQWGEFMCKYIYILGLKGLQCDYYYRSHLKLANQITVSYEQWIIPKFGVLTVVFRPLVIGSIGFGWNSLFLFCNLIGQFCLSDSGSSSHTITILSCSMNMNKLTWQFCWEWRCVVPVTQIALTTTDEVLIVLTNSLKVHLCVNAAFCHNISLLAITFKQWEAAEFCTAPPLRFLTISAEAIHVWWRWWKCRHLCHIALDCWHHCHVGLPCKLLFRKGEQGWDCMSTCWYWRIIKG